MIGVGVVLIYLLSLKNGFVSDDISEIVNKGQVIGNFKTVLSSPIGLVRALLYFIIFQTFGMHAWAFRLVNIFFHAGNAVLVYLIGLKLYSKRVAVVSGILFGLHPLVSEPVLWLSGMSYVIAGFFVLFSFYLYLDKTRPRWKVVMGLLSFSLAMVSIEKFVAMPLIFFFADLIYKRIKSRWKELGLYFLMALARTAQTLGLYTARVSSLKTYIGESASFGNIFFQFPVAIGNYLSLFFWPVPLTLYHSEMRYGIWGFLFLLILTLIFIAVVLLMIKRNIWITFWFCFFIAALVPTLLPLHVAWIVAERYVYLGTVGLVFGVVLTLDRLIGKKISEDWLYVIIMIVSSLLAVRTLSRISDWKNEDNLWLAAAKYSPASPQNHNNLGDLFARRGDNKRAIEEFSLATKLSPKYADAYHNLGNTYLNEGQLDQAKSNFEKAIELNPKLWESYYQLAIVYYLKKDWGAAKNSLNQALKLNDSSDIWVVMGMILKESGDKKGAKEAFTNALTLDPTNNKAKEELNSIK